MKRILFVFAFACLTIFSLKAQEHIVKFNVSDKSEIAKLPKYVSVDNFKNNEVTAYIWGENFEKFKLLGYNYSLVDNSRSNTVVNMATTVAQMANWDRYPTYDVYVQMMKNFVINYPTLCHLDTIGYSSQNRALLALRITDNINVQENEPEFFYTSTMHGDETTGAILLLRLTDYLLSNYGKNTQVTNIVNNIDLYINPFANPDGTYHGGNSTVSGAQREYQNGNDPNRNFPDPWNGAHPDGSSWNVETIAMMNFANAHHFVMSANFHGGAEVFNYPWDGKTSSQNTHPDNNWFLLMGQNYVASTRQINSSYMTDTYSSGVTEGADWYSIDGGRQDYMNYFHHCREVTIELSSVKLLSSDQLPTYWNYNKQSLLNYLNESLYGIRGVVLDQNCNPLNCNITVPTDRDSSNVHSNINYGNYFRPIKAGTYTTTYSVSGYSNQTQNSVIVSNGQTTIVDKFFGGSAPTLALNGTVKDFNNNLIADVQVSIVGQNNTYNTTTDANGEFSVIDLAAGTYKVNLTKSGYFSLYYWEKFTPTSNTFSGKIIQLFPISGLVIDAQTGLPIQNSTIEFLSPEMPSTVTDANGNFNSAVLKDSYQIKISKTGYASKIINYTIDSTHNYIECALYPSVAISFEDGIPSGFTFFGANWTRVNTQSYDAHWCMKSGAIGNSATTTLIYTATTQAGNFSFYKKVSSESGYDYLKFYVDGIQKGSSWSGNVDWSQENFTITAGSHIFKWEYSKDGGSIGGSDCSWVDYIEVPNSIQLYTITFKVLDGINVVPNASIHFLGYGNATTDNNGQASFANIYPSTGNLNFTADVNGFPQYLGNFVADANKTVTIQLNPSKNNELNALCYIFPNPVENGKVNINANKKGIIKIYNATGILQKTANIEQSEQIIDVSNLKSGVYLLEYTNDSGKQTQKLIIK